MNVRNLNGTNQLRCASGDWLTLWEKASGQQARLCSVKDCINMPLAAGLVQLEDSPAGTWYVIPLCPDCNKDGGRDLEIWDHAVPVSATETKMAVAGRPRRGASGAWLGGRTSRRVPEWTWE